MPSPYRSKKSQLPLRQASTGSYNGNGKGSGRHHQKKMPKKPQKQKAYEVTFKNSVLSEVTTTSGGRERKNGKVSLQKTVPSGPNEEGTYNRFSCFAVHGKMALSTNT